MAARKIKRSKVFSVPAIVGLKTDASGAMRMGRDQIDVENDFAQRRANIGRVFGSDGKPRWNRNQQKKYLRAKNEERADLGLPRIVNFDGGYGDET